MKTVEQIRERITNHKYHIGRLEDTLKNEVSRLQGDAQYSSEKPMSYDFMYYLNDHARKIEQTKLTIKDHMKAIELLEWVLASENEGRA